jgi:hypothetical protein
MLKPETMENKIANYHHTEKLAFADFEFLNE